MYLLCNVTKLHDVNNWFLMIKRSVLIFNVKICKKAVIGLRKWFKIIRSDQAMSIFTR